MRVFAVLLLSLLLLVSLSCNRDNQSPVAPDNSSAIVEQPLPTEMQAMLDRYGSTSFPEANQLPEVVAFEPPTAMPPLTDTSYDAYVVTILWGRLGNLQPTPTPGETVWDGHALINAVGRLEVCQTISFDPNQDAIVPDNNELEVVWQSKTASLDFDGLVLWVMVKRGVVYIQPPTFSIETAPFSLTLPIERLARYQAFFRVDNQNGVIIQAKRVFPRLCPDGLMFGDWIRAVESLDSGSINGRWYVANSVPGGTIDGLFRWETDHGEMNGMFLDVNGDPMAYFEGTWQFDDPRMCPTCGRDAGWFRGVLRNTNNELIGKYLGRFGDLTAPPPPGGQLALKFAGRWWFDCQGALTNRPSAPY